MKERLTMVQISIFLSANGLKYFKLNFISFGSDLVGDIMVSCPGSVGTLSFDAGMRDGNGVHGWGAMEDISSEEAILNFIFSVLHIWPFLPALPSGASWLFHVNSETYLFLFGEKAIPFRRKGYSFSEKRRFPSPYTAVG